MEVNQDSLSAQELAEATEAIQHEVLLLAGLNHPNLPRIHGQFVESGRPGSNGGGKWRAGLDRRFSVAPDVANAPTPLFARPGRHHLYI